MSAQDYIPLSVPQLQGNEQSYVMECLQTNWISSVGRFVTEFEEKFATYVGAPGAVAVVNGTSALHLALLVAGVEPGDLVITQSVTFIAPINAIRYTQADPVFLDIDRESLALSPAAVAAFLANECHAVDGQMVHYRTGRRVKAILPVHLYGHAAAAEELKVIADGYGLAMIEDAAEGVGAKLSGKPLGTFGDFGCYSFNGNKVMTTGGGGMLVGQDLEMLNQARHLSTQAKCHPDLYDHDAVGYNYRLTNLAAAIGVAQLERLDEMIELKRKVHERYEAKLGKLDGARLIVPREECESNYWMALLRVQPGRLIELIDYLRELQIQSRPLWSLNHTLSMYKDCPCGDLPESESFREECVCIPCHQGMTEDNICRVVSAVETFFV